MLNKTIDIPALWPASFTGSLRIASEVRDGVAEGVSIWLERSRHPYGEPQYAMKTLPTPQAIELRDALLEVYPVEPTARVEVTAYGVEKTKGWGYEPEWRVNRTTSNALPRIDRVATCHDEETARQIVALLESK